MDALHAAASLWRDLVLEMRAADSGGLQVPHSAADIQLIPIACVRVDKKGQIHTGGKVLGVLCLFTSADKTQIRHTQQAGCCCLTAHVTAVKKVSRLGGPGCNAVEGSAEHLHPGGIHHLGLKIGSFLLNCHNIRLLFSEKPSGRALWLWFIAGL